jgi:hypothetical protein
MFTLTSLPPLYIIYMPRYFRKSVIMMTSVNRTMAARGGNKHQAGGGGENTGGGSNALKMAMKQNNKLFRIGTVIAYIVAVCSGAAVLAIYYSFFWNPQYTGPLTSPIATTMATSRNVADTTTNITVASSTTTL